MKVLLIDDSTVMRNIQAGSLRAFGDFEIEQAPNGAAALQKIPQFKPDLILLDWNMPEMDGLTTLKAIRAAGLRTPVIMVTTEAEKPRVVEAIKAGVTNYLIKPFTPEGLRMCVEKTIGATKRAA